MKITIHRGTHQIGGCVTEISSGSDKIFIDFGADLPGATAAPPKPIRGLTVPDGSNSALFFTHYHGDHVGRLHEVQADIPIYMGRTAKALFENYARRKQREMLGRIDAIIPFLPLQTIRIGAIAVTPLMVDHSAFDAYMFVVEAEGKRVLHTGDFRLHGFRGTKTLPMLHRYAQRIDCVICETTNLSRGDKPIMTERELQTTARNSMQENKYVFVLCSSTNIDRIGAFYHANPRGRLFITDGYQKSQLETVQRFHKQYSNFYDFSHVYSYAPNLDELMEQRGFCMIIRQGERFAKLLERYKGRCLIIYSMWDGYLQGETRNEQLWDFLNGYPLMRLHTSGHAAVQDLFLLYHTVRPKMGLIPIHGETPEKLRTLLPDEKVLLLQDEEPLTL